MSRENVELVRSIYEAHDRGDFETVFAAYDPEVEWHVGSLPVNPGFDPVYFGHAGIRAFWREWLAAWKVSSFKYEEFIDAGEQVVVILSQRTQGRLSGLELDWSSYAQVWTVRMGKVVRSEFFSTRTQALEAVGTEQ